MTTLPLLIMGLPLIPYILAYGLVTNPSLVLVFFKELPGWFLPWLPF